MAGEHFQYSLAGRLIVATGMGPAGAELALASTLAGAAFLGLDPDPQHLKSAIRNASCDFMVNTLDEALRVLKNEIRKQKPVSVGLLGAIDSVLSEMVERGVQPDLIDDAKFFPVHAQTVRAEARRPETDDSHRDSQNLIAQLCGRGARWIDAARAELPADDVELAWTAAGLQDLQQMDRVALDHLPMDDSLRRNWLLQAPSTFHRQRPLQRILGVRQEELPTLLEAWTRLRKQDRLTASVSVHWQLRNGTQKSLDV